MQIRAKNQLRVNGVGFYVYFGAYFTVLLPMMFILCFALMALAHVSIIHAYGLMNAVFYSEDLLQRKQQSG